MVGRMVAEKDFSSFCEAARRLERDAPGEWLFLAIGDGDRRASLAHAYSDVIATGALEFLGFMEEVLPVIAAADVGVLMSEEGTREGCSNAIMEYMACGLPVVCSDGGGNTELVEPDRTALVIPPQSPTALVGALRRLREDSQLSGRLGAAGAHRLLTRHGAEAMAAAFVEVYTLAIREHEGHRRLGSQLRDGLGSE
jgi:glycosyltransferase involved in cell wall biosynthesis